MKDNILKREFKEKDVERLRNIVKGKHGDRTTLGVGYTKQQNFYKEGDVWEEDDRQWTIKDGIRQNVTKLDKAKKIHKMPMFCPSCNSLMHEHRDKNLYKIHGKCLNCVVDMEHELKKEGKWEDYQKHIFNSDLDALMEMYTSWMFEKINEENNSFLTERGDKEKWIGKVNKEKAMKALEEGINYLKSLKK